MTWFDTFDGMFGQHKGLNGDWNCRAWLVGGLYRNAGEVSYWILDNEEGGVEFIRFTSGDENDIELIGIAELDYLTGDVLNTWRKIAKDSPEGQEDETMEYRVSRSPWMQHIKAPWVVIAMDANLIESEELAGGRRGFFRTRREAEVVKKSYEAD